MSHKAIREFERRERVGAELARTLSLLLRTEVKDPRLGQITIQEVRVTRDLAHAKVFFTCFPLDDEQTARTQEQLLNGTIAAFLRRTLSRTERLRSVPNLHFVHDTSIRHGEQLEALITSATAQDLQQTHQVIAERSEHGSQA
jgi:ribosome-binding factor A